MFRIKIWMFYLRATCFTLVHEYLLELELQNGDGIGIKKF